MLQLAPLDLRLGPGAALLDTVRRETSQNLAALAERFARAFIIGSPWAPGLCCVGGEIALNADEQQAYGTPRLSVTGNGETIEAALISCLGEAADRLAVVERPGDIAAIEPARDALAGSWIAQAMGRSADTLDWIEARDAATAHPVALPADLCLRRAPHRRCIEPAGALSSGVAAGADFASAAVRAALELCERDAAALWWLGGRPPGTFALEHPASVAGVTLIGNLRQGRTDRRTLLLDITTELAIPTIAAASIDDDSRGLACGMAARLDWADAARAAVLEMCQMEMAAPLAAAKRAERGDAALNDADRRHLQRAAVAASDCGPLHARGVSEPVVPSSGGDDQQQQLASRLHRAGIRLFAVDLTRPDIGVAVARLVSPDLQPYTSDIPTDRLRHCRAAHRDAHLAMSAIPLM